MVTIKMVKMVVMVVRMVVVCAVLPLCLDQDKILVENYQNDGHDDDDDDDDGEEKHLPPPLTSPIGATNSC